MLAGQRIDGSSYYVNPHVFVTALYSCICLLQENITMILSAKKSYISALYDLTTEVRYGVTQQ